MWSRGASGSQSLPVFLAMYRKIVTLNDDHAYFSVIINEFLFFNYTLSPAEAEFDGLTARSETIQLCL
jgi:hypothetical protein